MLKSDVVTYLDCPARLWLDDHPGPISPYAPASPGPACATACRALSRCPAGQQYTTLVQRDSTRREDALESAPGITVQHSSYPEPSVTREAK